MKEKKKERGAGERNWEENGTQSLAWQLQVGSGLLDLTMSVKPSAREQRSFCCLF
jgi:hypothetical protein